MKAQDLKNSILQLAIQGKLVAQDENDEPAEILYAKIQAEKQKLIKEGKIKKDKPLPPITEDEIPFSIPSTWKWVRLGEIVKIYTGSKDANYGTSNGKYLFFTCASEPIRCDNYSFEGESLLLPGNGANVGLCIYYNGKFEAYQRTYVLQGHVSYLKYLHYLLNFRWKKYNEDKMYGSAMPYIKLANIQNFLVPLPPLEEQKRIVAKIEELEPLINQYDRAEQELSTLSDKFPEQLKKSILQYAIQGKLVAQDENDEPAEVLYAKIQAEKQKLIKEGKIKKDKPLTPITEDEIPFSIPSTWKWVRLGEIGQSRIGLTYHPSDISPKGTIVLRSGNIQNNKLSFSDIVRVNIPIPENLLVRKGDIIICARNGSKTLVGKSALIGELNEAMTFGAFMAIFRCSISPYVKLYLDSPLFKKTLSAVNTVTINQITQQNLNQAILPLPPLEEQKRIVARVATLLEACDKLIR